MLNQKAFNILLEVEKISYLRQRGRFLATRQSNVFDIKLYHLNNFFVEVYFKQNQFKCEYIGTFQSTTLLTPYLNKIKLDLQF